MSLDLERYRLEFPVTRSSVYLNHAAISPVASRVRDAMFGIIEDRHCFAMEHFESWLKATEATRASTARLLNADPEEIAIVKNTSEGISLFANGLELKKGDEVVSIEGEFPANYFPWKMLERQGVGLRLVKQEKGEIPLEVIERALTRHARVVAVSFVQFLSGYRINLEQLGRLCDERGVLLFVDAIQGMGAFPIDVRRAKIAGLAAGTHKWLMGPEGCGILFVRRDLAERMEPATVGWTSFEGWQQFTSSHLTWRPGAGRFECGALNMAMVYGLGAALELFHEVGVDVIAERILSLTDRLRQGLDRRGYRIYGPQTRECGSGIVSFEPRKGSAEDLIARLQDLRIMGSVRGNFVRLSPHFYNTEGEIDQALEVLS